VGSCSTLAGLTLGAQLSNLNSKIIGIRVAPAYLGPFPACTAGEVNKVIKQAVHQMRDWGINNIDTIPSCIFSDEYYGQGYGIASSASQQAVERFQEMGIKLENTYSGKAAAAFIEQLNNNQKPQLFWQTFNSADALSQAQEATAKVDDNSPSALSPALQAYLTQ
jgi:D-cysteine desulfhydrase